MAAAAYMSSLKDCWPDTTWMTGYRGDIRKYVAVASPFKGLDTMFRYYMANITTINNNMNCPVAFYNAYVYFGSRNYYRWDMTDKYESNYFQGQTQILHNWRSDPDHPIPSNFESWTHGDGNITMDKLYNGGTSLYIKSEGIDNAIANANGNTGTSYFIDKLNQKGLDPGIKLYVLYGTNQNVENYWWYPIGEKADASDGLLFVASATYARGVTLRGAQLVAQQGMDYNHRDVSRVPAAKYWIEQRLSE